MISPPQQRLSDLKSWGLGVWVVNVVLSIFIVGCAVSPERNMKDERRSRALVFGVVDLHTVGPNPRQFLAQLLFFDVVNTRTQERTRVSVEKQYGAFSVYLDPGQYEVMRIQINEGPFMAESHVSHSFHIESNEVVYLGKWQLDIDTPRTERMVKMTIVEDRAQWGTVMKGGPQLTSQTIVNSFPAPLVGTSRLYAITSNSKIKYFNRQ